MKDTKEPKWCHPGGKLRERGNGSTKIELYNQDMKKSMDEMLRVLKPQKYAVIDIGNASYLGDEIKTVEFTIDYMESISFKLRILRKRLKMTEGIY